MSDPAAWAVYEIEAERENWSTPHLERQIFTGMLIESVRKTHSNNLLAN